LNLLLQARQALLQYLGAACPASDLFRRINTQSASRIGNGKAT
jgi:hypothetical protein